MAPTLIRIPQSPQSVSSGSGGYVPISWPKPSKKKGDGVLKTLLKGSLDAVGAVVDTLSIPQREIGSLLSGDGLVDPYSAEAEKYDPSKLLKPGPGRIGGVGGFLADAVLDPLNLGLGLGVAKVVVKGGAKAAAQAAAREMVQKGVRVPLTVRGSSRGAHIGPKAAKGATETETMAAPVDAVAERASVLNAERANVLKRREKAGEKYVSEREAAAQQRQADEAAAHEVTQGVSSDPLNIDPKNTPGLSGIERQAVRGRQAAQRQAERRLDSQTNQIFAALGTKAAKKNPFLDNIELLNTALDAAKGEYQGTLALASKKFEDAVLQGRAAKLSLAREGEQKAAARASQNLTRETKQLNQTDRELKERLDDLKDPEIQRKLQDDADLKRMAAEPMGKKYGVQLQTRLLRKRVPLAVIESENLAKVVGAASKAPFVGAPLRALNTAFNPRAGIDQGTYVAGRGVSHMVEEQYQRETRMASKYWGKASNKSKENIDGLQRALYDEKLIDGEKPETLRAQAEALQKQADERALVNPEAPETKAYQQAAQKALAGADHWDNIDEAGRNFYNEARRLYKAEGKYKVLQKKIKEEDLVPNYVPTARITPESDDLGTGLVNAPKTLNTTDSTLLRRMTREIPEDQDPLAALENWSKTVTRARYNELMVNEVMRIHGRTAEDVIKQYGSTKGWTELSGSGGKVLVPNDIEKSMNHLAELLANPQSSVALVKALQDFVRRWKVLAYAANAGRFVIDTIGDFWNMALRLGSALLNPKGAERSFRAAHSLKNYFQHLETNEFEKADELGKEVVRLGQHDYTVRELAQRLEFGGMRNTGAAVTELGKATHLGRSLGIRPIRPFAEKGERLPRGVPRPIKGYLAGMQNLGNKRDNWSKRVSWLMALDNHSSTMGKAAALRNATFDVRVALFDYSELTPFEKRTMRNVAPFYTWTRKNIPYQVRMLAERPAMAIAPLRLQKSQFEDEQNAAYAIPDYARQRSIRWGQLPGPLAALLGQKKGQPFYQSAMIPTFDLRFGQDINGGVDLAQPLGMVNPLIKAPFELAMGKNVGTGAPLDGQLFGGDGGKGLPLLGNQGEYLFKTFGGQPANALSAGFNKNRSQANRILPTIGMFTGLRGTVVDPEKQTKIALMQAQMASSGAKKAKAITLKSTRRSSKPRTTRIGVPRVKRVRISTTSSVKPLRAKKIRAVKTTRRRRPRPVRIKTS